MWRREVTHEHGSKPATTELPQELSRTILEIYDAGGRKYDVGPKREVAVATMVNRKYRSFLSESCVKEELIRAGRIKVEKKGGKTITHYVNATVEEESAPVKEEQAPDKEDVAVNKKDGEAAAI